MHPDYGRALLLLHTQLVLWCYCVTSEARAAPKCLNVYRGRCFLGGWGVIQACRSLSGCSAPQTGAEQFMQVIPAVIHQHTDYAQAEKVSGATHILRHPSPDC